MSDGLKNRNMERRPGIIGAAKTIAKDVKGVVSEAKKYTSDMQTGEVGGGSWSTNLFDTLGTSVYEGIIGKQSVGGIGKSAVERALFGIDFPINSDTSVGFETKPIDIPGGSTRDFKFSLTKKF